MLLDLSFSNTALYQASERFLYFQSKWLKSQNLVVISLAKSDRAK